MILKVATFNYQSGGNRSGHGFDMKGLQEAFALLDRAPAVVLYCEAKGYRGQGQRGLFAAAEALSDVLRVPYIGLPGTLDRGPIPPAIFYRADLLTVRGWPCPSDPDVFDDQRNVARFAVTASSVMPDVRFEFLAWVAHFDPRSGQIRRQEAGLLDRYGTDPLPVIGGGDLNSSASGDHLPQRDWHAADWHAKTHKGRWTDDGTPEGRWVPDTDAVDHLIGRWDPARQRRVGGSGYHAVAELAWREHPEQQLLPTVNPKPGEGGGLLIDYLLANEAMRPYVIPASYKVHLPEGDRWPSDHRLVTADIDLPTVA
ncbi:hypothetical protein [Paractinoplanes toevensis]|uniref:Endonuclease/exonuclease/phosphatase domain-containing protein n=1 Tax=Paractinoplanes toevensis TaxID=571911 RepID=A0A919TFB8_9ACTN|nr:hypothetical protein [Actinoplanes toevensis]GIM94393.1 hypothetical protein Ato02nite_061860 [Actinoplanes toevensis]